VSIFIFLFLAESARAYFFIQGAAIFIPSYYKGNRQFFTAPLPQCGGWR